MGYPFLLYLLPHEPHEAVPDLICQLFAPDLKDVQHSVLVWIVIRLRFVAWALPLELAAPSSV